MHDSACYHSLTLGLDDAERALIMSRDQLAGTDETLAACPAKSPQDPRLERNRIDFRQNTKPNRGSGFLVIAMTRYYFNVYNDEITLDEEGADLADTPAALRRAAEEARNFAAESVKAHGHLVLHHKIEVEDEGRNKIGVVYFRDVVAIEP